MQLLRCAAFCIASTETEIITASAGPSVKLHVESSEGSLWHWMVSARRLSPAGLPL